MRLKVLIQTGDVPTVTLWLSTGQTLTVGRTQAANHVIETDSLMSRVHFKFVVERDECRVVDLNSSNGTSINDHRVTEGLARDGDRVFAGMTSFLIAVEAISKAPWSDKLPLPKAVRQQSPSGVISFQGNEPQPNPAEIVQRLANFASLSLIADFSQIDLPLAPHPVFLMDWLPRPVARDLSPVFMTWETDRELMLPLLNSAWGKDAIVWVYSKLEPAKLLAHLREAARGKHRPTAPPDPQHMFGSCRPSFLMPLLEKASPLFLAALFSGLEGLLFESTSAVWSLLAAPSFAQLISEAGFDVAELAVPPSQATVAPVEVAKKRSSRSKRPKSLDVRATMEFSSIDSHMPEDLKSQSESSSILFCAGNVAVLEAIQGSAMGRSMRIGLGEMFSVGRSEKNDIAFPNDLAMSGRHFQIEFNKCEVIVVDVGSRNGILVNGIPCKRAVMLSGDRLAAGDSVFELRFELIAAAPPPIRFTQTMAVLPASKTESNPNQPSQ